MKWLAKQYKPTEGQKRRVRKFAFLPTRCNDYVVWLETYESHQEYKAMTQFSDGAIPIKSLEWVEFERNHLELYL